LEEKLNIIIINGPNLNMLGARKPGIYGTETLEKINSHITSSFKDINIEFLQSNHEGEIIDAIHAAHKKYLGIIINPGALTHYSLAIRDAIESTPLPVVEVHITNIYNREDFRSKSVISPVCIGTIGGFGKYGYILAVNALVHHISRSKK
jgi:3-dehydroquinate dehydratase-2